MRETPQESSEPSSQAPSILARTRMPKRATTYPGNTPVGRQNYSAVEQELYSEQDLLTSAEVFSLTQDTPSEMPGGATAVTTTTHSSLDKHKEFTEGCHDQDSAVGSPSRFAISQAPIKPDNFMDPLFSPWAVDQCNSLYDQFDEDGPYMHGFYDPAWGTHTQTNFANDFSYGSSEAGDRSLHNERPKRSRNENIEPKTNQIEGLTTSTGLAYRIIENE